MTEVPGSPSGENKSLTRSTDHRVELAYKTQPPSIGPFVAFVLLVVACVIVIVFFGDVVIVKKKTFFADSYYKLSWFAWLFGVGGAIGAIAALLKHRDQTRMAKEDPTRKIVLETTGAQLAVSDDGSKKNQGQVLHDVDLSDVLNIWMDPNFGRVYYITMDAAAASFSGSEEDGPMATELALFAAAASLEERKRICLEVMAFIQQYFPDVDTTLPEGAQII